MIRPMLAATAARVEDIQLPALVSPKLDGVRALVQGGVVLSRSLKPIPNKVVQQLFGRRELEGLDGELVIGDPWAQDAFRRTSSGVMSHEDPVPNVVFHVFDRWSDLDFERRLQQADLAVSRARTRQLQLVGHQLVYTLEELAQAEAAYLAMGYEGLMARSLTGSYKEGRSTLREQGLMKLKRFEDAEALVLRAEPLLHNANAAVRNELGYAAQSSHQAGKVAQELLGALVVRGLPGTRYDGVEFSIGTGFDEAQRRLLWQQRGELKGRLATYKYFPSGSKEAPRFPVFKGFRAPTDC